MPGSMHWQMNKTNGQRHCCSFFIAQWRQTTVNEHSHGTECIHSLVLLAKTELNSGITLNP